MIVNLLFFAKFTKKRKQKVKIKHKYIFLLILLSISAGIIFSGCKHREYRHATGMIWHTSYHITYLSDRDLNDSILSVLSEIDASLNVFSEESLVSRLNKSDSIRADQFLKDVYECSVEVNRKSDGAFDPTLSPLITAWGFGKGHKATSDTARIEQLMKYVGLQHTRLQGDLLVKDSRDVEFNFSAIAKGYACDMVGQMLRRNGASNYMVEIGGEISMAGDGPGGRKWNISIDKPVIADTIVHESQIILNITDCGIATSGNYRNFHRDSHGTYGHTIDAKSGRPKNTDVLSATVIASTAMEADAWATSMMALGSRRGLEIADSLHLAVMLVKSEGGVATSKAFETLGIPKP